MFLVYNAALQYHTPQITNSITLLEDGCNQVFPHKKIRKPNLQTTQSLQPSTRERNPTPPPLKN